MERYTEKAKEALILAAEAAEETPLIHNYTLRQIYEYAKTVPAEEISFIKAAYDMNLSLIHI